MEAKAKIKYLKLSEDELEGFTSNLAAYLPKEVVQHGKIAQGAAQLIESLDELASPEVCAARAERFSIKNPAQLAERVIFRDQGRVVLAGLRFRKLNPEFPFIHLTSNFLLSAADLSVVKEKIKEAFYFISPKGFTLRATANLSLSKAQENWSHTVYGATAEIPAMNFPEGFRIVWNKEVEFYPAYHREYQSLLDESPALNTFLRFEEETDLQETARNGLLMSVYDQQGWAGVIGGKAKEFYGYPCLYIFEIFLSRRLRGKGMAKALEAAFLRNLSSQYPHVFGHINDSNHTSLRTALAMKRRIVESEYFIPL